MLRITVSMVLVLGLVATSFAQRNEQRSDQRPARKESPSPRLRSLAETGPLVPATTVRQFDRQPKTVRVQVLIATISFGEGKGEKSATASAAGSVADALARKINSEVGVERAPMSVLTKALDGVLKETAQAVMALVS